MTNTYFIKSQNGGLGVIDHMGYTMAKHGVIALTKGFKFAEPTVYNTEGIKCSALAPYYVDTNFVSNIVIYLCVMYCVKTINVVVSGQELRTPPVQCKAELDFC